MRRVSGTECPYDPLAFLAPVIGPEQQPTQCIRRRVQVKHGAYSSFVGWTFLDERTIEDRQAAQFADTIKRALQGPEVLLLARVQVAHEITLAQRVIVDFVT